MEELSNYYKGFIAAAIDCDGHIIISKVKNGRCKRGWSPRVIVGITNTNLEFLEHVKSIVDLKSSIVKYEYAKDRNVYKLIWNAQSCRELLPQIRLVIKEDRRVLALKVLELVIRKTKKYDSEYERKLEFLLS